MRIFRVALIARGADLELGAALELARLDGESRERRAAVQRVYDTFTEGFEPLFCAKLASG